VITSSIEIERPPADVFAYLDELDTRGSRTAVGVASGPTAWPVAQAAWIRTSAEDAATQAICAHPRGQGRPPG
jgi:hypothetical protein